MVGVRAMSEQPFVKRAHMGWAFAADMADGYFPGAVLSRVGDQGDYTRANCRWLTKSENSKERFA